LACVEPWGFPPFDKHGRDCRLAREPAGGQDALGLFEARAGLDPRIYLALSHLVDGGEQPPH
jgi:hypothetical protein